jgi:acyl-lipid omega-6 desaturase (Delta-12 desaturase)
MESTDQIDYKRLVYTLKPYAVKNITIANYQLVTTFVMLWSAILLSYYLVSTSNYLLLIASIPLTTAFMCRSYVIEHDCGHQSFYRRRLFNTIAGNIMGFGILIPYSMWKFIHDSHHSHVGNLDKREFNPEIWTMTVREFKNSPPLKRLAYRIMRSRFTRLIIVPTINFGIVFRLVHPKFSREAIAAVLIYDLIYALIFYFIIGHIGFTAFFLVFIFPLILFYCIAAFTFYAQHQFEETYWENDHSWDYYEANFKGSTCIQAPGWYRWLTGNVLFHNVHHIFTAIPNYNLKNAEEKLSSIVSYKHIRLKEVWNFLDLKLWDEESKKLVSFKKIG